MSRFWGLECGHLFRIILLPTSVRILASEGLSQNEITGVGGSYRCSPDGKGEGRLELNAPESVFEEYR
jgi:hypothetical protein